MDGKPNTIHKYIKFQIFLNRSATIDCPQHNTYFILKCFIFEKKNNAQNLLLLKKKPTRFSGGCFRKNCKAVDDFRTADVVNLRHVICIAFSTTE